MKSVVKKINISMTLCESLTHRCFILIKRVTGWHGLFPSWEGLGVGSFPRFHEVADYKPAVETCRANL